MSRACRTTRVRARCARPDSLAYNGNSENIMVRLSVHRHALMGKTVTSLEVAVMAGCC